MPDLEELLEQEFGIHQRFGDEVVIECPDPDHSDERPSAWVNTSKGLWICYSCGAGGKVEDILPRGVRVNRDITLEQLEEAIAAITSIQEDSYYPESWLRRFTIWDDRFTYWEGERGLTRETIEQFKLGWDPDERAATYPLRDTAGRVLGVVRRFIGDQRPKYKYPRGAPIHLNLFAYERVASSPLVVLTEGAMDALAWWDVGVPAVSQYGGLLSDSQVRLLSRSSITEVVCCFDNDRQGLECLDLAMQSRLADHCLMSTVVWDGKFSSYKDPAEVPKADRRELLDTRITRLDYLL